MVKVDVTAPYPKGRCVQLAMVDGHVELARLDDLWSAILLALHF